MAILADLSKRGKFLFTLSVSAIISLLFTISVGPSIIPMAVVISILAGLIAITLPTDKKKYHIPFGIGLACLPFALYIGGEVLFEYMKYLNR